MSLHRLKLRFTGGFATLRELRGHDEHALGGTDSLAAIRLLDRLLVDEPGAAVRPGQAAALTVADRDALLAAVYRITFGPIIQSTARCEACGCLFDLDFRIDELSQEVARGAGSSGAVRAEDGSFLLPDGRRFRLPTGEDELAIVGLSPAQAEVDLRRRCLIGGDEAGAGDDVLAAMEAEGGVIDLDADARCPECAREQVVHFAIQGFLLRALAAEREALLREVHRLAIAYGWSLREILRLPRAERRSLVKMVEVERPRAPRAS